MSAFVRAEGLTKRFAAGRGLFGAPKHFVQAATDVSLAIERGTTLGLVGESGSGKSTVGQMMLALTRPTAGRAFLDGVELTALAPEPLRKLRRRMQMVFQNPYGALNPRVPVGEAVELPLRVHRPELSAAERRERAQALFARVGLRPDQFARLPSDFSGGQRQRIVIARALAAEPDFVFADEPVSALDVSVQAQIVNLLADLQAERGLTYLFVSHDLKIVQHVAHRVAVMYLGRVIEEAPARRIFAGARHPYTRALLSAVPDPRRKEKAARTLLEGELPSPLTPPPGCAFHPRCPLARKLSEPDREQCRTQTPALLPVVDADGSHRAACHFRALE